MILSRYEAIFLNKQGLLMIQKDAVLHRALLASVLFVVAPLSVAKESFSLSPLVVTAAKMDTPYSVIKNPRLPEISAPAQDGGAALKSIPGFSLSRKGGTSGEPAFRGLGGSRLGITMDGGYIPGGCSGRMDPPTAYVFPHSYDRIAVTKGPQSVRYAVAPAGSVRFERDKPVLSGPETRGFASFTSGSYERNDLAIDTLSGDAGGYLRLIGTLSAQDDYQDGNNETVHSAYQRWSTTAITGWTPGTDTHIELAYDRSDGEARYDDRRMDGTDFDRTGYRLSATRENLTPWLKEVTSTLFYNDIDHVMDNFRLRDPGTMTMARKVVRTTAGGRFALDVLAGDRTTVHTGFEYVENQHGDSGPLREMGSFSPASLNWRDTPVETTADFVDVGVFAEIDHDLSEQSWMTLGLRGDYHEVEARSANFSNVSAGVTDHSTQWSLFGRYEYALNATPANLTIGLGRTGRAPDYWERQENFFLKSEALTQLDTGFRYEGRVMTSTLSVFYGWYDDYILITDDGSNAENIGVTTLGSEADVAIKLTRTITANGSVAYTRSKNTTRNLPLAQTPPLEGALGLDYGANGFSAGIQWRAVASQHRVDPGSGTIYSVDTDKTPGFATLSGYLGTQLFRDVNLTGGVDNVFDRAYAEHIQRGSADFGAVSERINEPGRLFWANVSVNF